MANESDQEKDLPPSERRLEKAKEEGDVLRLPQLPFTVGFPLALLAAFSGPLADGLGQALRAAFASVGSAALAIEGRDWMSLAQMSGSQAFALAALGISFTLALVAGICQVGAGGWIFKADLAAPKGSRVSPLSNLSRLFSPSELGRAMLSAARGSLLLLLGLWLASKGFLPLMFSDGQWDAGSLSKAASRGLWLFWALFALPALLDSAWAWRSRRKKLFMSLQELKDEMKESEGDPHAKAARRARARRLAASRMMQRVPEATVVVVNPEHFAVALRYDPSKGDMAPVALAKGVDQVALRIRDLAGTHGVPVLSSPPLARALWRACELERPVSERFFTACALAIGWAMQAGSGKRAAEPAIDPELWNDASDSISRIEAPSGADQDNEAAAAAKAGAAGEGRA